MKRLVAAVVAGLVGLVGCASIPTSGGVEQVTIGPSPGGGGGAEIAPVPPAEGASRQQIVGGFLVAMASGTAGLAVARAYLTEQAASAWAPEKHPVQIYAGDASPQGGDLGTLSADRVGVLDPNGHFSPGRGRIVHDLQLTEVAGQWRIAAPPEGLVLSEYMFGRYYQSYPIYFMNRHNKVFPELVYLPSGRGTPTQVLQTLALGPSEWLAPSVLTAIPVGTTVSVTAVGQVAQVAFDASIEKLGEEDRRRLGAQVIWTLSSFPRIVGVTLTAGGAPYEVPGQSADGVLDLASQQGYQVLSGAQTSELFAVSAGRLGRTSERGGFMAVPGAVGQAGIGVQGAALSADGLLGAAVLADGRLWLGNIDTAGQFVATGMTAMLDPQVLLNSAWVAGTTASGGTALVRVEGSELRTAVIPAELGRVVTFRVHPSGTSVAVILDRDGQHRLGVMRVEEASGVLSVTGWREVSGAVNGVPLAEFWDVDWSDESTLFISARAAASNHTAFTVSYDGAKVSELGPLGGYNVTSVSTQPRKSGLIAVVRTDDGQFLRVDSRARWQLVTLKDVQAVLYAG